MSVTELRREEKRLTEALLPHPSSKNNVSYLTPQAKTILREYHQPMPTACR